MLLEQLVRLAFELLALVSGISLSLVNALLITIGIGFIRRFVAGVFDHHLSQWLGAGSHGLVESLLIVL